MAAYFFAKSGLPIDIEDDAKFRSILKSRIKWHITSRVYTLDIDHKFFQVFFEYILTREKRKEEIKLVKIVQQGRNISTSFIFVQS